MAPRTEGPPEAPEVAKMAGKAAAHRRAVSWRWALLENRHKNSVGSGRACKQAEVPSLQSGPDCNWRSRLWESQSPIGIESA